MKKDLFEAAAGKVARTQEFLGIAKKISRKIFLKG